MKKTIIIHPLFFAIYPILFLYAHNIGYVLLNEVLVLAAITVVFSILLFLLLKFILKSKEKAGLITSLFLLLFFSYGHFVSIIGDFRFTVKIITIGANKILFPIWCSFFLLGTYFSIKTRKNLHDFTNLLNIVSASLLIISLLNITIYELKTRKVVQRNIESTTGSETNVVRSDTFPDIYYIILDGYASLSTLKEIYGYDNQGFFDYLEDKGFCIPNRSKCNYIRTFLSMVSSLNIEYIDSAIAMEPDGPKILCQMLEDNRVMHFLKERGYKFVNFRSGCALTDYNKYADLNIHCGKLNEFLMILIRTTMIRPFERYFLGSLRERTLRTFSELAEIQHSIDSPMFVFAHILAPHPPYLFGPNGESIKGTKLKLTPAQLWKDKKGYLGQLIFINKKVELLVAKILSEVETSPIIILQADHGPGSLEVEMKEMGTWEQLSKEMLKEKTEILNAYYLPGNGKNFLYDSITPVNTFRLIFNHYFNANYELLEDKTYFSRLENPCKFIDVTDKIK